LPHPPPHGGFTLRAAWRLAIPLRSVGLITFSLPSGVHPAEAGKNGLPAFRWNGFHGIEWISRSSSTPHLESQRRSLDNYPDTGGILYTVIEYARRRGIDPQKWLSRVLDELPRMKIQDVPRLLAPDSPSGTRRAA